MYNKIVNPQTGRKVNINSELGNKILKQYLKVLIGGVAAQEKAERSVPCSAVQEDEKAERSPVTKGLAISAWLSTELTKLGMEEEDAEIFSVTIIDMLNEVDPSQAPLEARDKFSEVVQLCSDVSNIPVESLNGFSRALWQEWASVPYPEQGSASAPTEPEQEWASAPTEPEPEQEWAKRWAEAEQARKKVGKQFVLTGMNNNPDLNNILVKVVSWNDRRGRYGVKSVQSQWEGMVLPEKLEIPEAGDDVLKNAVCINVTNEELKSTKTEKRFEKGSILVVTDLIDSPELNGQSVYVSSWDDTLGLYEVLLKNSEVQQIKHENLKIPDGAVACVRVLDEARQSTAEEDSTKLSAMEIQTIVQVAIDNTIAHFRKPGAEKSLIKEEKEYLMGLSTEWHVHIVGQWHVKTDELTGSSHALFAESGTPLKNFIKRIGKILCTVADGDFTESHDKEYIPISRRANYQPREGVDVTFERYKVIYFCLDILDQLRKRITDQNIINEIMLDYYLTDRKIENRGVAYLNDRVAQRRLGPIQYFDFDDEEEHPLRPGIYQDNAACAKQRCGETEVRQLINNGGDFRQHWLDSGRKIITNEVKHQYCRWHGCDKCENDVCGNYYHIVDNEKRRDSDRKQLNNYVKKQQENKIPTADQRNAAEIETEKNRILNLVGEATEAACTATLHFLRTSLNRQIREPRNGAAARRDAARSALRSAFFGQRMIDNEKFKINKDEIERLLTKKND